MPADTIGATYTGGYARQFTITLQFTDDEYWMVYFYGDLLNEANNMGPDGWPGWDRSSRQPVATRLEFQDA